MQRSVVRLIDDLADVSRVAQGKLHLRRERVPLADVIAAAVEATQPLIERQGHELTVEPVPDLRLDADPTRLAQVISNLLTNAARYTEPGGRIVLSARRDGGGVVLSVRDTGIGIPAAMLPRLFEMFSQADRHLERTTGGLGIGLSLVKGLVEMHGGTVEARSDGEGKGSEFVVRLPLPSGPAPEEPQPGGAAVPAAGRVRRVLVVDDEPDGAESLAAVLSLFGNEVRTAPDGEAGVEVAETFRPDVILLDIGMPRVDGYEACRRIRGRPWGRGVVIVALTGWGTDDDRRQARDAGFDHHLTKPVNPADLRALLENDPGPR